MGNAPVEDDSLHEVTNSLAVRHGVQKDPEGREQRAPVHAEQVEEYRPFEVLVEHGLVHFEGELPIA